MRKMNRIVQRRERGRKRKIITSSIIALSVVLASLSPMVANHSYARSINCPRKQEYLYKKYAAAMRVMSGQQEEPKVETPKPLEKPPSSARGILYIFETVYIQGDPVIIVPSALSVEARYNSERRPITSEQREEWLSEVFRMECRQSWAVVESSPLSFSEVMDIFMEHRDERLRAGKAVVCHILPFEGICILPPPSPLMLLEEARLVVSGIESELKSLEESFATEMEEIANIEPEGGLLPTLVRELERDHETNRAALENQLKEARFNEEALQYYLRGLSSDNRLTQIIGHEAIAEFLDRAHYSKQDAVTRYQDIIWAKSIIEAIDEYGIDESGIYPKYIIRAHNIIRAMNDQNTADDASEIGSDAPPILDARAEAESLRPDGPDWTPPIPPSPPPSSPSGGTWTVDEGNASTYYTDCEPGIAWIPYVPAPPPPISDDSSSGSDTDEGQSRGKSWTLDEGNASTYCTDCEPSVPRTDDSTSTSDSSTSSTFDNWNPDTPADTIYTDCEPGVPRIEGTDSTADTSNREEAEDSSSDEQDESQPASECPIGEIPPPPPSSDTLGIPAPPPPDNSSGGLYTLPESPPTVPEGTITGNPGTPLTVDCADHGGGNQDMTE